MVIAALPPGRRRLLAVAVLVGLLLILYLLIVAPYVSVLTGYDESIDDKRFRLDRLQNSLAARDQLAERLAMLEADAPNSVYLLSGDSFSLAAARLQESVKQFISRSGAEHDSTQVLVPTREGGLQRVTIRVKFQAYMPEVQKVLHGIEHGRPLLFIDQLNVQATRFRARRRGRIAGDEDTRLQVTMDVVGYRRGVDQ